jgi:hypothetical protein
MDLILPLQQLAIQQTESIEMSISRYPKKVAWTHSTLDWIPNQFEATLLQCKKHQNI